jgi:predicted O-methyltransferase YrrM/DNA-binding PadR family transcriptional regulator
MINELFVLGELMEGPHSGYDLRIAMRASLGRHRKISFGVIYPLLDKLAQAGLVEQSNEPDVRNKKITQITEKGKKRFFQLMNEPIPNGAYTDDLYMIKLDAMQHLPLIEQIQLVNQFIDEQNKNVQEASDTIKVLMEEECRDHWYARKKQELRRRQAVVAIAWADALKKEVEKAPTKQQRLIIGGSNMNYEKVHNYIEGLYKQKELTKQQYSNDTELDSFGAVIDDDVARMMQVLIQALEPRKTLEIGTSIGFSTVMMAKAMKSYGGKIVTIELDKESAEQAKINFERQGVSSQIEVLVGDAREIVKELAQEYDLIFQDVGEKKLYAQMLDSYLRILKTGGVLLAEDTMFPAPGFGMDTDAWGALDSFNRNIADSPHFVSTLLPIGDGLTIAVKKQNDMSL